MDDNGWLLQVHSGSREPIMASLTIPQGKRSNEQRQRYIINDCDSMVEPKCFLTSSIKTHEVETVWNSKVLTKVVDSY